MKKSCCKSLRLKRFKASKPHLYFTFPSYFTKCLIVAVSTQLSCCQEQVRTPCKFIPAVTHSVDDRCEFREGQDCSEGFRIVLSPVRQMQDSTSIKPRHFLQHVFQCLNKPTTNYILQKIPAMSQK